MKKTPRERRIIHLDMDAFYPSVEVLDRPELKGKPVIVGGGVQRGVVSSASYEARRFGVHSAQPIARALRLCPDGIFLKGRMSRYKEISRQVFEIFLQFTPLVEPLSIDEAFLDITESRRLFGSSLEIARAIKAKIFKEIGLTISAGVAPSKFIAKIASDIDKPDGLTVVKQKDIRGFLDSLSIKRMWGVGKETRKILTLLNIRTFKDLRETSIATLISKFGKNGSKMHQLAMGIDERQVVKKHDVKSISNEITFIEDIIQMDRVKKELLALSNKVAYRMRKKCIAGRTVMLKVKYYDFIQLTRSETITNHTDDGIIIYSTICKLLQKTNVGKKPVRLLGVCVSNLEFALSLRQRTLFDEDGEDPKRQALNKVMDLLFDRFGEDSILPGTLFIKEK